MAKSDARFEYRANLNRDAHDLGNKFTFTATSGMLLPVFADIATPGDSYYIEHDLEYLRTAQMLSPAFIDVKVHYESFFVPMQMIYQPIEQSLFSMKNPQSNFYGVGPGTTWLNNDLPVLGYRGIADSFALGDLAISPEKSDAFRLSDMLGLNADNFCKDEVVNPRFQFAPSFFPWQLLAYHTIFQYYYRLDDKSKFDNTWSNIDNWYNQDDGSYGDEGFFEIHQRPWDFDYFTSMYRSPIVSDASMQRMSLPRDVSLSSAQILPSNLNGGKLSDSTDTNYAFRHQADDNNTMTQYAGVTDVGAAHRDVYVSTAVIRQMFANEKLAMITGRARKTYDSQVLAHYGVKVPHDPKHDIAFIGHDTYDLHIGEVTSLASTSGEGGAGLGDLAGKGWANGKGHKHKFTAPCHGVVMTIFSIEPKKRYFGGFARQNAVTNVFDLPTPELDRLGNMPMFRYEAGENAGSGIVTTRDIIGWKERYYYWKRRYDRVTLAFMVPRSSLGYNSKAAYMISSAPFGAYTSTNNNTARPDLESRFYIDRNCMDNLMLTPYIAAWQDGSNDGPSQPTSENWNRTPWLVYSRDPFIVDSDLKVTKVSWMSKDGEPVYNY